MASKKVSSKVQPALMTEHSAKEDVKVAKKGRAAKPAPQPEKKAVKPEKRNATLVPEKAKKAKVVHYPIADISKVEFVPKWVYANIAEKPHQPVEGEFSYVMVYKLIRELEPNFVKVPVDVLYDLVIRYAAENPNTPIAEWCGPEMSKRHKGDLKARLKWCIVETLRRLDAQNKK
jgi:hypothetical protein